MRPIVVGCLLLTIGELGAINAPASAQESGADSIDSAPIVIRRLPNGVLAEGSTEAIRLLVDKAKTHGEIVLWVSLGVPFQANFSGLTPEQVDSQKGLVEFSARQLMEPLILRNAARYYDYTLNVVGQGFRIVAAAEAVESLVAHELVIQLVDESRTRNVAGRKH